jgi:hypothetical protein
MDAELQKEWKTGFDAAIGLADSATTFLNNPWMEDRALEG